jgi:hypothetical protein
MDRDAIKGLLELAYTVRLETETLRRRWADDEPTWVTLGRVLATLKHTTNLLLDAYAQVVADEKAGTPLAKVPA